VTPDQPLGLPEQAATVRIQDGQVVVTEGPFVNAAGAVGGYFVLDVSSREKAVALAASVPATRLGGSVELRPAEVYW
jgi:hypothetical protein